MSHRYFVATDLIEMGVTRSSIVSQIHNPNSDGIFAIDEDGYLTTHGYDEEMEERERLENEILTNEPSI